MKKGLLTIGVFAFLAIGMVSCESVDANQAADEYCACAKKTGDEKTKCVDAWVEKYKGLPGVSEEDAGKMGEKMGTCGGFEAVDDIFRLAE